MFYIPRIYALIFVTSIALEIRYVWGTLTVTIFRTRDIYASLIGGRQGACDWLAMTLSPMKVPIVLVDPCAAYLPVTACDITSRAGERPTHREVCVCRVYLLLYSRGFPKYLIALSPASCLLPRVILIEPYLREVCDSVSDSDSVGATTKQLEPGCWIRIPEWITGG